MKSNKLKLNAEKTEVMPVGSQTLLETVNAGSITVGDSDIDFTV